MKRLAATLSGYADAIGLMGVGFASVLGLLYGPAVVVWWLDTLDRLLR